MEALVIPFGAAWAVLCVLTLIIVRDDVRSRTAPAAACYGAMAAGLACGILGSLSGAYGRLGMSAVLVAAACPAAMVILSLLSVRYRLLPGGAALMHEADAYLLAAFTAAIPLLGKWPVAVFGLLFGLCSAAVWVIGRNVAFNIADMASGRRMVDWDVWFFAAHYKRRGEAFTVSADGDWRCEVGEDGGIRSEDGGEFFVPRDGSGMRVWMTIPMTAFIAGGMAASVTLAAMMP